jgi:ATP-binding cassette subfamily B (MDR/TAP) protein 1
MPNILGTAMCLWGGIFAGAEAVGSVCLELSKNRQVSKWKKGYIRGILRQEVGWYDVNKPQELSTRMGESLVLIEKGLGAGTIGLLFLGVSQLITGLAIGFYFAWDLAAITTAAALITFAPASVYSMSALDKKTKMLGDAYGEAGGVASETLSGLRTVVSLGLEPTSLTRYERCLRGAERAVIATTKKLNFALSMMDASMFIVLGVPTLYATFKMYDEYKKTEFEYTFNDYDVCAHTCDPCAARPRPSATTPPPPP